MIWARSDISKRYRRAFRVPQDLAEPRARERRGNAPRIASGIYSSPLGENSFRLLSRESAGSMVNKRRAANSLDQRSSLMPRRFMTAVATTWLHNYARKLVKLSPTMKRASRL